MRGMGTLPSLAGRATRRGRSDQRPIDSAARAQQCPRGAVVNGASTQQRRVPPCVASSCRAWSWASAWSVRCTRSLDPNPNCSLQWSMSADVIAVNGGVYDVRQHKKKPRFGAHQPQGQAPVGRVRGAGAAVQRVPAAARAGAGVRSQLSPLARQSPPKQRASPLRLFCRQAPPRCVGDTNITAVINVSTSTCARVSIARRASDPPAAGSLAPRTPTPYPKAAPRRRAVQQA
jgi:hypothetical protein